MIILLSGGLDSTVLAARETAAHTTRPDAVSVDYGQRHRRELDAAAAVAAHYGLRHDIIDLTSLGALLAGSALTGEAPLPEGHYTDASMAATVVPGRNLIMLAAAAGIANARGHGTVAIAAHAGDHPVYPDCRPAFLHAASAATQAGYQVSVEAPFAHLTKAQIVTTGHGLGAPMGLSWSCYAGGARHCGRCGTCVERAEAFDLAGVTDPTRYADPGYWRTAAARV